MDLKLLLQYPKAVQVLLAALQKALLLCRNWKNCCRRKSLLRHCSPTWNRQGFSPKPAADMFCSRKHWSRCSSFCSYTPLCRTNRQNRLHPFSRRPTGGRNTACNACHRTRLFESVVSGNSDTVHLLYTPLGGKGYGELSRDPLRNLKYHLVITISMLTRYCIQGGMPQEEAFNLSDLYIQRTDTAVSEAQIHVLHYQAIQDFTGKMRRLQDNTRYSPLVLKAMDYISIHLHSRIFYRTLPMLPQ